MNRNSKKAKELASILGISGRRLEDWTHEHLGPLAEATPEQEQEHYRFLLGLTGQGKDNDRAAILLAVSGRPCGRYRKWLMVEYDFTVPQVDPETDEGFAAVEDFVSEVEAKLAEGGGRPTDREDLAGLRRLLDRARLADSDTSETAFHSLMTSAGVAATGGSYYAGDLVQLVAGADSPAGQGGHAPADLSRLSFDLSAVKAVITDAPLPVLVAMAKALRDLLHCLPKLSGADPDRWAALMAPIMVAIASDNSSAQQIGSQQP